MFKSIIFAVLAGFAVNAVASNSLTVGVSSDNIYRGQSITEDSVSAQVGLRFDDLFAAGLYLRGDASTTQLTPVSDNVRFRSDVGVGLRFDVGQLTLDGSLNRVLNPALRDSDYNEARFAVRTNMAALGLFDFYGNVNYTLNERNDWYTGAGVLVDLGRLNLRAGGNWYVFEEASGFSTSSFTRNNWEAGAEFDLWRNFVLTGLFSDGSVGFGGVELGREWLVGVRATF